MAAVINYDLPVANFIDGLSATEHVTHTAYRKTSVTFHHNGGRLSHQGVLDVWKVRPASAHFDVDGAGAVAQYVKLNEYAWAAGNTEGNKSSVHIELANATTQPKWEVAEATWKSGARLAGWIFAKAYGIRPDRTNVKVHHDWKATLCAGPFIDRIYDELLAEVVRWYEHFAGARPAAAPAPPAPSGRKSVADIAREVLAGAWGNGTERSRRLQAAGYSPTEVQAEVNRRLGHAGPAVTRLSISVLADQVIKGQWGNGTERQRRIIAAGYDYNAVRDEVNRKLRSG